MPKGSSPESYDPTPAQLVSLGDSKAYLRIGHIGFEQSWMDRLLENTPHLQVFDTSKGIDLIYGDSHQHTNCQHNHSGVEPHVWNSTANGLIIARNTYKALSALDSSNEPYFLARYDSLCQEIQKTDSLVRHLLSSPNAAHAFMIYHPALSYFARDYELHQIAIEEGGKEPSSTVLKDLIDLCKTEQVKVIFIQPEFDKRNAEVIAEQTNTRIIPINPLSYEWKEELIHVAKSLSE